MKGFRNGLVTDRAEHLMLMLEDKLGNFSMFLADKMMENRSRLLTKVNEGNLNHWRESCRSWEIYSKTEQNLLTANFNGLKWAWTIRKLWILFGWNIWDQTCSIMLFYCMDVKPVEHYSDGHRLDVSTPLECTSQVCF